VGAQSGDGGGVCVGEGIGGGDKSVLLSGGLIE
jgi:hypothetical protein